ncbi:MAG: DUF6268 family outer membrane beta-barrel protein [Chlamydiota bacterium]
MKKILSSLFCSCLLATSASADTKAMPFEISGHYLHSDKADFKEDSLDGQKIGYSTASISGDYIYKIDDYNELTLKVGDSYYKVDWDENPHFSGEEYNNLNLGIAASTAILKDWVWWGSLFTKIDTDHFNFTHYTTYGAYLWGMYEYSPKLDLHIGIYGDKGLKKDNVIPILGVNYTPSKRWEFTAIYPKKLSAAYKLTSHWTLSLNGRSFRNRHRVDADAATSKGIFEYRARGADGAISYESGKHFQASIFGGVNFGGDLKVSNKGGDVLTIYKFKSAPYAGASAKVKF